MCFNKPRRRIKLVSSKTLTQEQEAKREWLRLNPPDERGRWYCYLQISPKCYKVLTTATLRQEHVKSKVRYPELKYVVSNRKAACDPCNAMKGSRDLDEIPEYTSYPQI